MSVFKVNNEELPPPVSASWSIADLSSAESGRSTRNGAMSKDIIAQKRTLTKFPNRNLSGNNLLIILKLHLHQSVSSYNLFLKIISILHPIATISRIPIIIP